MKSGAPSAAPPAAASSVEGSGSPSSPGLGWPASTSRMGGSIFAKEAALGEAETPPAPPGACSQSRGASSARPPAATSSVEGSRPGEGAGSPASAPGVEGAFEAGDERFGASGASPAPPWPPAGARRAVATAGRRSIIRGGISAREMLVLGGGGVTKGLAAASEFALSRCVVFLFFGGAARTDGADAFDGRGGRAAAEGGRSPLVEDGDIIVELMLLTSIYPRLSSRATEIIIPGWTHEFQRKIKNPRLSFARIIQDSWIIRAKESLGFLRRHRAPPRDFGTVFCDLVVEKF